MSPTGGGNIKVVVRVRPFNGREIDRGAKCIIQMKDSQTILTPPPDYEDRMKSKGSSKENGQKIFAFDKSYWSFDRSDAHYAGQKKLHEDLGKPLLDNAFKGYNNCIFAYGQTGSGKSYSMMGYGKEAGVIPQICQDMFVRIENMQKDPNLRCTVEVSYLEIYNERVRDLLNPSTKSNLKVREHPSTGPYVEDLAKLVVSSFNEIEHLMDEGNKARTVAATNMNETSSRSHAVFTLTVTQKKNDLESSMAMEKVAKISLVDLAGSERATSTGATGARLKEGAEINRSLSTLGRVIAALADLSDSKKKKSGKGAGQVPYRDSVLTWLLKDSLGGNSMTAMIAAISPADINFDETLSTLRYADSAKRIKNHAVVNEDANARMIRELKEELVALRSKLSGGAGRSNEETYSDDIPFDKQIVSITQSDGTIKKVSKAEIAEQLSQSEKLYLDLNQTWEEKLAKTEEIHKEREAALEELGISIEKGFIGLHTPKKMPHLVNLSDDPLLAECLVYNLKPGLTTVGNLESNTGQSLEIRLNGSRILKEHCTFENLDNVVTLIPKQAAAVMVNGNRIVEPKRLRSGYRVILGDFHIFRFNHPLEVKADRVEKSSLRHSIIANQIGDIEKSSASSISRSNHERRISRAYSEVDWDGTRPSSPLPYRSRDSDWSFARREAAGAILGSDKHIAGLTDDELNYLFEDVQKVRAERGIDEETDSVISYSVREKYMSNGTLDSFSFNTTLTTPSTPKPGNAEDLVREAQEEMLTHLDRHKEEYQEYLKSSEAKNAEIQETKRKKVFIEENLREIKSEMLRKLDEQRKLFQEHTQEPDPSKAMSNEPFSPMTRDELSLIKKTAEHWRSRKYVKMVESILCASADLKEAQILSLEMDQDVNFQFVIIQAGHDLFSSYDMVLNGITCEGDDLHLEQTAKPCIGVRIIDHRNHVIRLWSLEKLQKRVQLMRQMHQQMEKNLDHPQQIQLDNPFMEKFIPQFSHIGDVDVPLSAVFESRVQDFTVDVISPYTTHTIGILKLSLEPSSAQASPSKLKFNVVIHDLIGFAEREGTDVHAQIFLPTSPEEGGVSTTQMVHDFDEGPIRFESVHSQIVPVLGSAEMCLRVAFFARVSPMHLEKLLSWDEMQDNHTRRKRIQQNPRISEAYFLNEEKYEIFAKIRVLELAENGEYVPVKVVYNSKGERGLFQLHQGIQRRIMVNLVHSSGDAFPWQAVTDLRVGSIKLEDNFGNLSNIADQNLMVPLKLISSPVMKQNANGISTITIIGQWDSSLHSSLVLERITAKKLKIRASVSWEVTSPRLSTPIPFSMDIFSVILPRSNLGYSSILTSLFQNVRIAQSVSGIFSVSIRPSPVKKARDLWRVNTLNNYVKGEEVLTNWKSRGVSLIWEHIAIKKHNQRLAEIEAAQPILNNLMCSTPPLPTSSADTLPPSLKFEAEEPEDDLSDKKKKLLQKYVRLWKLCQDPISFIITPSNTEPPNNGITSPSLQSTVSYHLTGVSLSSKNPTVLKHGYLLTPSMKSPYWVPHFVELRRPYLHLYSKPDCEEMGIISLRNSRVDHSPPIAKLLRLDGGRKGRHYHEENFFAIYGTDNTWLFMARSEKEKIDWIWKIDKRNFISGSRDDLF